MSAAAYQEDLMARNTMSSDTLIPEGHGDFLTVLDFAKLLDRAEAPS